MMMMMMMVQSVSETRGEEEEAGAQQTTHSAQLNAQLKPFPKHATTLLRNPFPSF